MRFTELLTVLDGRPLFTTGLLLAGAIDRADVSNQLSRWVAGGKIEQLRRGLYVVARPFRRRDPHPFEVANALQPASYVSLEAALAHHGIIPEAVFVTTSVTTGRPESLSTPLGRFEFRHVSNAMMWGYSTTQLDRGGTTALVARPEKALLDLVYLRPDADDPAFLAEMRFDVSDTIDPAALREMAGRAGKPKLSRAAEVLVSMAAEQAEEWVPL